MKSSMTKSMVVQSMTKKTTFAYVETLRSIQSRRNIENVDNVDELLYSPRSCPICCEDYVKGDDVAWSKNEDCCHAYHTDCIVPWLMDHDDCPMCRCVYVKEEGDS